MNTAVRALYIALTSSGSLPVEFWLDVTVHGAKPHLTYVELELVIYS
jgi:hypothetical protein